MDSVPLVGLAVLVILFVLILVFGSLFTVSQTERALIERYSRFLRVTGRGLQIKVPIIDAVRRINTQLQQFETQVETKTKDNVFVTIFVSIQLFVMEDTEDHIRNAYYKLYNPALQIQSYVANAILGHVPSMDFDEVFTSQVAIADFIKAALDAPMEEFGRSVHKVQVTKITPPDNVRQAMDNINAARRDQEAAKAKGEADKIIVVKEAEAQMERDILLGKGIAGQRAAIVDGLARSVEDFKDKFKGIDSTEILKFVVITNYFDTLKEIAGKSHTNTIFMNHSPGSVDEVYQRLTSTLIASGVAGRFEAPLNDGPEERRRAAAAGSDGDDRS
ncbi:MAG TPA: SPFH domain-containing protein [Terriglobales bacterium]|jgi:regulator of protease activity HflC (stomatin/prohibitin superfamily)|nr:SPFH domain-containing protein [Terriglobales bacterium]